MKFRQEILKSGTKIFLGKDAESNDELMRKFKGKENTILHTEGPGSPFCVIEKLNPQKKEVYESGVIVSKYSQDWRDNKSDVAVSVFTGKDIKKEKGVKIGTWTVKGKKSSTIKIKKEKIMEFEACLLKGK